MSLHQLKYSKVSQNEDDLIEAYFMKGKCMLELVNYNEAYQCFQKVIEMRPKNTEVMNIF